MEQIRLAKKEDAIFIAMLGRITFTEAFGHLFTDKIGLKNYLDTTFNVDKIKKSLEKENNMYWIAFVNKLPVGYAKLKLNSTSQFVDALNVSQLQKIYVLHDFLSMKIGKKLQNLLLQKATENGSEKIWLSVYVGNKRAIGFYERNDFKKVGTHQFSIGKDHFQFWAMEKTLENS
ncbi:GNAT family N-acetyltransferase [uncultured Croceitalea sp.]|uniref:GNAT family N-acetyltransferase n=1 Tax=uncultured Croceitalea sp. TaxID=1798908 RepID=UPI003306895C